MKKIFLDNNSTTPRDFRVLEKYIEVEKTIPGNSSSKHIFGWEAEETINIAKRQIADLLNVNPELIIFTSGATESNSLAILGYHQKSRIEKLEQVYITSNVEHSSVLRPLQLLKAKKHTVHCLKNDMYGYVNFDDNIVVKEESLLSISLANNEIGTIQDLPNLRTHFPRSFIHSDLAQAVGKIPVDFEKLKIDCGTISAHKMYGPVGIGALIFNSRTSLNRVEPLLLGGGQQNGFRSGTMPTALIAAFGEAAQIAKKELVENQKLLTKLSSQFIDILRSKYAEISLVGENELSSRLPGNLSIHLAGVNADSLAAKLASKIAFSTGSACGEAEGKNSHVLEALAFNKEVQKEIIRIGIGKFNTEEEISFAAEEISRIANLTKLR